MGIGSIEAGASSRWHPFHHNWHLISEWFNAMHRHPLWVGCAFAFEFALCQILKSLPPLNKSASQTALRILSPVLLAIFSVSAQAQNLVTNPGFETGTTTGWFAFGPPTISVETSQVHSGSYACLVTNRTAAWNGIAQSFVGVLQAGQTYDVSAWVRLVSGGNQTMQLTMQGTDGGGTSYSAIASGSVSSTGWTQLSGQYSYNPSGTVSALNFYAEVPSSSNASYYIDDVNLSGGTIVPNPPLNGVATVNWSNVHQRIDGFGASSAWSSSMSTAQADLLFSTNNNISYQSGTYNGVGLSLLRNHITFANTTSASDTPTTAETSIMVMAQTRGARVWSAPWTPASGFKSTNDVYDSGVATGNGINGGSYLGSGNNITNINYASQLANYVARMKNTYGVNIYALSIQNEPDANVTSYEACQWTGVQFHDFVTNLNSALTAKGFGSTKVIIPESQNWTDPRNLAGPAMSDPIVAAQVGIIANHNYVANNAVGDQSVPAAIPSYGKALWETEVALLSGSDSSIGNGVYYARRIHLFLTRAQVNAYHYWWLVSSGNQGLIDTSAFPTKRLFAFGQFSRFVRPNFYRIDATSSQASAWISAYKDSTSTAFAIVVINTNATTDVIETVSLTNFTAASVTPWITSSILSLAPQAPVPVTNSAFTCTVPAMSVVTFVGEGNTPPAIGAGPDQTANVGLTLLITNTGTDSDLPVQTVTFAPAKALPANATLDATSGVFSWRPLVSQANTTNLIQIQVTDSGSPNLSATNALKVVVNPINVPVVIGEASVSQGRASITVDGPHGPDYTLFTSTNLTDWWALFVTNSPSVPFTFVDTNSIDPARFYRYQIGP